MSDFKRAHSPETNGDAGAIVKKQRTEDGSLVVSAKQPKEVSLHLCNSDLQHFCSPSSLVCAGIFSWI